MSILEIITYNVLKLLKKCFSAISADRRYKLSLSLAGLLYRFTNLRKNQARKNIKIAFPSWSDKKIENTLKKNYQPKVDLKASGKSGGATEPRPYLRFPMEK